MDRFLRVAALAVLVTGCGSQAPSPTATFGSSGASAPEFAADTGRLRSDLVTLQGIADANGGIRAAGTPGYEASVDAMAAALEDIGFAVDTPAVSFTGFTELPGASLVALRMITRTASR